jgi:hypothetical protein
MSLKIILNKNNNEKKKHLTKLSAKTSSINIVCPKEMQDLPHQRLVTTLHSAWELAYSLSRHFSLVVQTP